MDMLATSRSKFFELQSDLNFAQQFNSIGVSDRTIIPLRGTGGNISGYNITKTCVMTSGESKIYRQTINANDVQPFMEITLPDQNIIDIQSILVFDTITSTTPTISEFMNDSDNKWYEVDNLTEDKIFTKDMVKSTTFTNKLIIDLSGTTITGSTNYGNTYCGKFEDNSTVYGYIPSVAKWNNLTRKYITEYTDNGYCKIIFGGGSSENIDNISAATDFTQFQLNKIINNKFLGELPKSNSTIYIYYTVGGGKSSNIANEIMTNISFLDYTTNGINDAINATIKGTLKVKNTTPSISGRDELTNEELRYLIKYNNQSQDRCVTLNDYINRILVMPSEFGAPLKVGAVEVNNKILITMLGLSYDGTLSSNLSETLINNIITYLSEYRMINDYIEIQPGRINNLQFEVDVTLENDKSKVDIIKSIMFYIGNYMDINNHSMGDEIYISKLKSDIGAIKGIKNLIDLRVYSIYGNGYSPNQIKQPVIESTQYNNRVQIDLIASDGVLYSDNDTMFEVKNPRIDIIVFPKSK